MGAFAPLIFFIVMNLNNYNWDSSQTFRTRNWLGSALSGAAAIAASLIANSNTGSSANDAAYARSISKGDLSNFLDAMSLLGFDVGFSNNPYGNYLRDFANLVANKDNSIFDRFAWNFMGNFLPLDDMYQQMLSFDASSAMMDLQVQNQMRLMDYQQELNSPFRQVQLMRQAGLNPDVLGLPSGAGIVSGGSAAMGSSPQFSAPNSAQQASAAASIRQADAATHQAEISHMNSLFNFSTDLARVFIEASEAESNIKNKDADTELTMAKLDQVGLLNESIRADIESEGITILEGINRFIDENYYALGGKDFTDFDSLGIGQVYKTYFENAWKRYGESVPGETKGIINDTNFQIAALENGYAANRAQLLYDAFKADAEYRIQFNNFYRQYYSELEAPIMAALDNARMTNQLEYEETYNPEEDALAFNSERRAARAEANDRAVFYNVLDSKSLALFNNAQTKFNAMVIGYQKKNQETLFKLADMALAMYKSTNKDKYLYQYYGLVNGQFMGRTERWLNNFGKITNTIISPLAQGAMSALLMGKR